MVAATNACSVLKKGQRFACGECGITFEVVSECNAGCADECEITLKCCGKEMKLTEG
ncbi:hypothetical protein V7O62_13785 [Methanolobus sp. ZRKC2]|uniref:hypothetical protein n=1 Tax=Methanolobus sp. ZRKC2 TaxID=3125783 RepID=UPI00324677E0